MLYKIGEAIYYINGVHETGRQMPTLFITKWEVLQVGKKYVTIGASGCKPTSSLTTRFIPSDKEDYETVDDTINQLSHYYQSGYMQRGHVNFGNDNTTALIFKSRDDAEVFIKNWFGTLQYTYTDAYKGK